MTSVRQYKLTLHNCTRVFCWMLRTDVLVFPIAFMTSFLSSIERAHGNFYSSITTSPCVLPHYNSLLSAAAIRSYASGLLTAAPFLGRPTAPEHDSRNGQFSISDSGSQTSRHMIAYLKFKIKPSANRNISIRL